MLESDLGFSKKWRDTLLTLLVQRSRTLDFVCDAAVRLAALAAACERDGYLTFVYLRLQAGNGSAIRTEKFGQLVTAYAKAGRLAGVCNVEHDAVVFTSAQHSYKGSSYRLKFSSVPVACAMLSIFIHYASEDDKAKIFQLGSQKPRNDLLSDELAAEMRSWLQTWLNNKTLSEHKIKQASAFRGFLLGLRTATATFYKEDGEGRVRIEFPQSIDAADKARRNRDAIEPTGKATANSASWSAAGNDNLELFEISSDALKNVSEQSKREGMFNFDCMQFGPVPITEWHRTLWPTAARQYDHCNGTARGLASPGREKLKDYIDDEMVLLFWQGVNRDEDFSSRLGFRKFRTVARALVDYKKAFDLAVESYNPDFAISIVESDGSEKEFTETVGALSTSPLLELLRLENIKWLQNTRLQPLYSIVDAMPVEVEAAEEGGDAQTNIEGTDREIDGGQSLFGCSLPDRMFSRTLLRYHCFGDQQELAIRKSRHSAGSYQEFVAKILEIAEAFEEVALATSWCLLLMDEFAGLYLLEFLQPDTAESLGLANQRYSTLEDMAAVARNRLLKTKIGAQLEAAYIAINRQGFRKKPRDLDDPAVVVALGDGARPLRDLLELLSKVRSWYTVEHGKGEYLPEPGLDEAFERDGQVFRQVFAQMYPAAIPQSAE